MLKALVTVFLAIALASPALAQMMDMPMEHRGPGHGEMCHLCTMEGTGDMMGGGMMDTCLQHADKLGLSEEQISKIKPVHRDMKKKQVRFKADLEIAQMELKEIMEVKDFDLEKAAAQVRKIGDMKTTHRVDMLKSMKEIRSMLTDEQFKKMKKMMPMMMEGKKPHKKMMKKK